ncbi:MAG: hypothetical protein AAFY11_08095 [Cyanobacteria bacterium J06641_5]
MRGWARVMVQASGSEERQQWVWRQGCLQRGHGVASGMGSDRRYPRGTIAMQLPYFQALGLDLTPYFQGTLNVSISPTHFELVAPEYTFERLRWTDLHPPETFSFSPCRLRFGTQEQPGLLYYPHPETKEVHFQDASTLEVLAPPIAGIQYGDYLMVGLNSQAVRLHG